jgi:hypothetical protein
VHPDDVQLAAATSGTMSVASCVANALHGCRSMLRDAWKSDAIVQSDCCDSVNTMKGQRNPHTGEPVANVTEALVKTKPATDDFSR